MIAVNILLAEFRESITYAIPKIIALLSLSELNVQRSAADALSKLSGKGDVLSCSDLNIVEVLFIAEFHELIRAAIPQIITLLGSWNSDVCEAGRNALMKLSEQCKVSKYLA